MEQDVKTTNAVPSMGDANFDWYAWRDKDTIFDNNPEANKKREREGFLLQRSKELATLINEYDKSLNRGRALDEAAKYLE